MSYKSLVINLSIIITILIVYSFGTPGLTNVRVVTELNIGESQDVKLSNGEIIKLKLLEIKTVRDSLRDAIRAAYLKVSVDGEETTIGSGNYNLPVIIGKVQIDCPAIKALTGNSDVDSWHLSKDARFRLWPKGSPYIQPGTFVYPIREKWFASMTQLGNEPTYVSWGGEEDLSNKKIYYHNGHDIGGTEGLDEVLSAVDGLVISANGKILKGYDQLKLRGMEWTDAIYLIDDRGWYYEYAHLTSTDPLINPGVKVKMGQRIGVIGKQGTAGGWVHLHFEIKNKDNPSGSWTTEDSYAYCWEAYVRQYKPALIAVARPHQLLWTGQEATFDGSKSRSFSGDIVSYEWTFTDGSKKEGAVQKRRYEKPGEYSEILKITDSKGNVDYDFAVVLVYDRHNAKISFPTIQAAYHPSLKIKPGDPVTFLVCSFFTEVGNEEWDFGDNSPPVKVKSQANFKEKPKGKFAETVHSYAKPGHYIVKVERSNELGYKAITHLHVLVDN